MSQPCRRLLLILFVSISLMSPATAQDFFGSGPPQPVNAPAKKLTGRQIYRRLLNSTGWIVTRKSDKRSYSGTGWIVDAEQRLFVTCHHVVSRAKSFVVLFPDFRQGKLVSDPRHYQRHVRGIKGRIIDSDPRCDLALVQLESIPKNMKALPLAKQSAVPSDRLHVVGGKPRGSEALWTYGRGVARSVNRQTIANGHRIQILQSQDGSDRGNSGGAVLNDSGEVVAVVQGGVTNARNVGLNVDLSELKRYLKAGLPMVAPKTIQALVQRGTRHLNAGRYDTAILDFNAALRRGRKCIAALIGRGLAFFRKGDKQTALCDFNEAIKIDSQSVEALRGRFNVHHSLGNFPQALSDINKAIPLLPQPWKLYNLRGNCFYSMKKYRECIPKQHSL